ncbi:MAG: hypothetical protein ACE37K_08725 [Planctomycetota bacterium]
MTHYVKEKFGIAAEILSRDGSQQNRLLRALKEVIHCAEGDFPTPELAERWQRILDEAAQADSEMGRVPKTIAGMSLAERSALERQLLDLAERIASA